MKRTLIGLIVILVILTGTMAGWAQTNLTVVRHTDNSLWAMTCEGDGVCSDWTKITGKFTVQPTLTWDPVLGKYILIGIGSNKTSIWRGTFEADGTWNNDWTDITGTSGGSPSPVAVAAGGYVGVKKSPMELALRKWYGANQVTTFAVGSSPHGVAFDGANIWVANYGSDNVTKLNAATGAVVGTYAVGDGPIGIAFDGANIWVANYYGNNVTKLNAATGAVVGTYAVYVQPYSIEFDGGNIWVTNAGSHIVAKLNAATGALISSYVVENTPIGIAFDGANIWVTSNASDTVTKLNAATGAIVGTYAVGDAPQSLAFDGANIWVTNANSNNVTKL
jgi:YVTN family beta-propeller protein